VVHLWRVPLSLPAARRAALARTLSEDERARAARLRHDRDRDRYETARGALRAILGRYLDIAPESLRFQYPCRCGDPRCRPERRKPALATPAGVDLRFNVTHSHDLALIAVAFGREVGVDLERVQPTPDALALAERWLTPTDAAALRALPAPARDRAFLEAWTRREAHLKALGVGLPGAEDSRAAISDAGWSIQNLTVDQGYVAALATEGEPMRLRRWRWPVDPRRR
jgi:4'-phosphopantetheinyl transferase